MKLFDNVRGTALTGGTVTYPANGVLDLDAGMAECFVKIESGTASDTVISSRRRTTHSCQSGV